MKAPIRPKRPDKPIAPNKDKTANKHSIDISHLFLKEEYWDENGNAITKSQYDRGIISGKNYDKEEEELTPSIKSLIALIPPGQCTEDMFLDLSLGYDSGRNYVCRPFQSISLVYTTPVDYDAEVKEYNKKLIKYETAMISYKESLLQFKKDVDKYKIEKDAERLAKKKSALEAELAFLNGKTK